jgi:hypothetical protein
VTVEALSKLRAPPAPALEACMKTPRSPPVIGPVEVTLIAPPLADRALTPLKSEPFAELAVTAPVVTVVAPPLDEVRTPVPPVETTLPARTVMVSPARVPKLLMLMALPASEVTVPAASTTTAPCVMLLATMPRVAPVTALE